MRNGISPLGLLRGCLDDALNDTTKIGVVFDAIHVRFKVQGGRDLLAVVTDINTFRNTYVAHQEKELTEPKLAETNVRQWIQGLRRLSES